MSWLENVYVLYADRNRAIEGLRAVAVMMVFNVHFFGAYYKNYFSTDPLTYAIFETLHAGHFGVDVFFVISGFLIWKILFVDRRPFARYALDRVKRLMPAYALNCFMLSLGAFSLAALIDNLLFLPTVVPSTHFYNVVAWSLGWEWLFYLAMMGIAAVTGRDRRRSLWLFAALLVGMGILIEFRSPFHVPDPFRFSGFFVGALLAEHYPQLKNRAGRILGYASVPLIVLACFSWGRWDEAIWSSGWFGPLSVLVDVLTALLIAFLLNFEGGYRRALEWMPLRIVGQVSYTLYLTHGSIAFHLASRIYAPHDMPSMLAAYVVWFAVAFVLATFLFCLTERPYLTRRRLRLEVDDRPVHGFPAHVGVLEARAVGLEKSHGSCVVRHENRV